MIHLETIGMMTKYQLVFIKLETTLIKIGFHLKQKYTLKLLIHILY